MPVLWVRSRQGPIGGVCEGLGQSFGVNPKLLRFLWLLSVILSLGSGILFYILLYLVLPAHDEVADYQRRKVLGVCYRFARYYHLDLGLLRFITVLVILSSIGTCILIYGMLYFFAPKENE